MDLSDIFREVHSMGKGQPIMNYSHWKRFRPVHKFAEVRSSENDQGEESLMEIQICHPLAPAGCVWGEISKGTTEPTSWLYRGRTQERNNIAKTAAPQALALKSDNPVPLHMSPALFKLLPGTGARSECFCQ